MKFLSAAWWRIDWWLDLVLGMPVRFWMVKHNEERIIEAYECRVSPSWCLTWFLNYLVRPMVVSIPEGRFVNRIYLGMWIGRCRLGHQHVSPASLISWAVIWFNVCHFRHPLKYANIVNQMQLDRLINEMKQCGFNRREVPNMLQEKQEADPRMEGVTT